MVERRHYLLHLYEIIRTFNSAQEIATYWFEHDLNQNKGYTMEYGTPREISRIIEGRKRRNWHE
jgi:hypothetical protein